MATKTESNVPAFMLSSGEPIAPIAVEADLQARVHDCEAAREDAVWNLVRFYSFTGRQEGATAASRA